jgi:hypothetical protein
MVSAAIKKRKKLYRAFLKDEDFKRKHLGMEGMSEDSQVVVKLVEPPLTIETFDDSSIIQPIDGLRPASAVGDHWLSQNWAL